MSFLTQEAFDRADAPGERMSGLGQTVPSWSTDSNCKMLGTTTNKARNSSLEVKDMVAAHMRKGWKVKYVPTGQVDLIGSKGEYEIEQIQVCDTGRPRPDAGEYIGSFLTQEAFDRANAPGERMGAYPVPPRSFATPTHVQIDPGTDVYATALPGKPVNFPKAWSDGRGRPPTPPAGWIWSRGSGGWSLKRAVTLALSGMGDLGCPCKNKGMGDMGCPCGDGGMGLLPDDPLAQLAPQAAKVQATVSPYLWIFSIVGFGLALLNTSRVDSMWKRYGGSKFKGIKKPNF